LGKFLGCPSVEVKKDGAEKQFTLAQGFEWTGVDTIDDYC